MKTNPAGLYVLDVARMCSGMCEDLQEAHHVAEKAKVHAGCVNLPDQLTVDKLMRAPVQDSDTSINPDNGSDSSEVVGKILM